MTTRARAKVAFAALVAALSAFGATPSGPAAQAPAEDAPAPLPELPERYQTIVDRQMFGPLPPDFDPTKPASAVQRSDAKAEAVAAAQLTQQQEKLKSAIRFSMINRKQDGTVMVGFTDSSNPKETRSYYLKVGESRDGWMVKEADPLKASMTVVRGDIEVALTLGGDSSTSDATKRTGDRASDDPSSNASSSARRNGRNNTMTGRGVRDRRRQREQQEEARMQRLQEISEKRAAELERKNAELEQRQTEKEQEISNRLEELMSEQKKLREAKDKAAKESAADASKSGSSEGGDASEGGSSEGGAAE